MPQNGNRRQNQHRATGTTTSHHRKQRYTPPPLAKHANELKRAPELPIQRTNKDCPYQEPSTPSQHHKPEELRSQRPKFRSEAEARLSPPRAARPQRYRLQNLNLDSSDSTTRANRAVTLWLKDSHQNGSSLQRRRLRESLRHRNYQEGEREDGTVEKQIEKQR